MNGFWLTLFVQPTYYHYKLTDVIANSFNGYIARKYVPSGSEIYFPVLFEEGHYYLNNTNQQWRFDLNGKPLTTKAQLKHGDYIIGRYHQLTFSFLVTAFEKSSLNSQIYQLEPNRSYKIGRSDEAEIVLKPFLGVSRHQATLIINDNHQALLRDVAHKSKLFVNGVQLSGEQRLADGDVIFVMGTTLIYFSKYLLVQADLKVNGLSTVNELTSVPFLPQTSRQQFFRTPRIHKDLDKGTVQIDAPPPPQHYKELPFLLTVGPSLTMSMAMLTGLGVTVANVLNTSNNYLPLVTSGSMTVSMLMGALFWPKILRNYYKKTTLQQEQRRVERYRQYLAQKDEEIGRSYRRNMRVWNDFLHPSPTELVAIAKSQTNRLWERSLEDVDFLEIRLGNGERPFELDISLPKVGFEVETDSLRDESRKLLEKYRQLNQVPVTFRLKENPITGVIGDFWQAAEIMIANLATFYDPNELKLVFLYNKSQERRLRPFLDLPHTWSSDGTQRLTATELTEAHRLFNRLEDVIQTRENKKESTGLQKPYLVIFVFEQTLIEALTFKDRLLNKEAKLGISTIFFESSFALIPKEASAIIEAVHGKSSFYIKNQNNNRLTTFRMDQLNGQEISALVKALSAIETGAEQDDNSLPELVSFMDLYQVGRVKDLAIENHWHTNASTKSLAAPIGVMSNGNPFSLDIHEKYHGSHGLVAGTTGSGKSEFLQAYILSMMLNYSPNDVAFILVDFKGGDMARPFLETPHLAATISNLSGNTLSRALLSLEAEVRKRQRIFNETAIVLGINKLDINSYQRYFKEGRIQRPLPHLVIIIDEFAQLKTKHPEFMDKLIDIAQVGRSLGIHLILATQKPSGVVDPQMWSNSRFKVCLKVLDKQDSTDMLGKPVAAFLKEPGRAYVQVGYDEIFELVQSAYSGLEYEERDNYLDEDTITVSLVNALGEPLRLAKDKSFISKSFEKTQLEVIVEEVIRLGDKLAIRAEKLWKDPLPTQLTLEDLLDDSLDLPETEGQITCGLLDLPEEQAQIPYRIDFIQSGHLAIYGAAGTGKSTLLQTIYFTLLKKFGPKSFESIIVDCDGGSLISLSKLPNCIRYATDQSEEEVKEVLDFLQAIIEDRRRLFTEIGCANYASYRDSGYDQLPLITVLFDNYAVFRDKFFRLEDRLIQLVSAAQSCGIFFIITGNGKNAIYYKITDQMSQKIVFHMNDENSYRDLLQVPVRIYPEVIKGRALIVHAKTAVEVQIAVPFEAHSEVQRMQLLRAYYQTFSEVRPAREFYKASLAKEAVAEPGEWESEEIVFYQPSPMKHLASSLLETSLRLGSSLTDHQTFRLDVLSQNTFVALPKAKPQVKHQLLERLSESVPDYLVLEVINTDGGKSITQLREVLALDASLPNLVVIDDFPAFYDVISDEDLELLIRQLKAGLSLLTFGHIEELVPYQNSELYLLAVKCQQGVIIGQEVSDELAFRLNNGVALIPSQHRKRELTTTQAFIYVGDQGHYIQLED